jgi:hypothetical protein
MSNRLQYLAVISAACAIALGLFFVHQFWLVVVSLIWLGTRAVLPRSNPLLFWPVGLLVLVTFGYLNLAVYWTFGIGGIGLGFSRAFFAVLTLALLLVVALRTCKRGPAERTPFFSLDNLVGALLAAAVPLTLVVIGTVRVFSDPVRLISGHLAGGDHGRHNWIIHDLMVWSETPSVANPFDLYAYPRAIHFTVANILSQFSEQSTLPFLAQEYVIAAWFNWVQLAAYLQLCATIVIKRSKSRLALRATIVIALFFAMASINNLVIQLFWMGFTTSLAMAWIFLIPLAWPWTDSDQTRETADSSLTLVGLWLAFTTFGVYQLYSVMFVAVAIVGVASQVRKGRRIGSHLLGKFNTGETQGLVVGALVCASVLGAFAILGRDSGFVSTMLLPGFTKNPYVYTVIAWAACAVFSFRFVANDEESRDKSPLFLYGLLALTVSLILVVIASSDLGIFGQPYYIQKLLWLVMLTCIPILCANVLATLLDRPLGEPSRVSYSREAFVLVCILLIPVLLGRGPVAASDYEKIDWFASEMVKFGSIDLDHSTAFSGADALGTHVANLALKSRSSINMPQDLEFSLKPYLACQFINSEPVETVFTDEGGRFVLLDAGCDPMLRYVEPSRVFEPAENDSQ